MAAQPSGTVRAGGTRQGLPREIAFWGPSSSGKTWLMQSLARSLQRINQEDPDFEYVLAQPEALAAAGALQGPQNQATSDAYDRVWLFQRKVRPAHDTPAHRLSAHCHSIVVRDAPGELLMQGADNVVMVPLRDAQCVIAVLDPSLIDTTIAETAAQPERAPAGGLAGLFGASAAAEGPAGAATPGARGLPVHAGPILADGEQLAPTAGERGSAGSPRRRVRDQARPVERAGARPVAGD